MSQLIDPEYHYEGNFPVATCSQTKTTESSVITHATTQAIVPESSHLTHKNTHTFINPESSICTPIYVDMINIKNNHTYIGALDSPCKFLKVTPTKNNNIIDAEGLRKIEVEELLTDDTIKKDAPNVIVHLETLQNIVNKIFGRCEVYNRKEFN